jgi:hypothetical protein
VLTGLSSIHVFSLISSYWIAVAFKVALPAWQGFASFKELLF